MCKIEYEFNMLYTIAKRRRFKYFHTYSNVKYCHFVFYGYRIEMLKEKNYYIICICKGSTFQKTNNTQLYNDKIICIKDNDNLVIYDEQKYKTLKKELQNFFEGNKNKLIKKYKKVV